MKATVTGRYSAKLRYSSGRDWAAKVYLQVNSRITPLQLQSSERGEWKFLTIDIDLKKGLNEIVLLNNAKGKEHLFFDVMYITPAIINQ